MYNKKKKGNYIVYFLISKSVKKEMCKTEKVLFTSNLIMNTNILKTPDYETFMLFMIFVFLVGLEI